MSLRRKILLAIAGVLVLVPTGLLYWVATTEAGLRFLVTRLHEVGPVTLTVEGISGTQVRGFGRPAVRADGMVHAGLAAGAR